MPQLKKVAIVAGEASGDILGAGLIAALKKSHPDCKFVGVGGERMLAQGFDSWFPMERLAVMGLIEPLKRIFELLSIRKQLKRRILALEPDVFIGIDAPDFNLNLEGWLKERGVKTVHYVSPSVWAWRQGRIKKIKRAVDMVLSLFPFEEAFYKEHEMRVCCVGHTLADDIPLEVDKQEARTGSGLSLKKESSTLVALLPGSRASEVRFHTELFLKAAELCVASNKNLEFVLPAANKKRREEIQVVLNNFPHLVVHLQTGNSHKAMAAADAVLLASGTTALEAMLLKKPMVVAYKMSGFAFAILKRLVKTQFVSLPNLLANKALVPECLQRDATPENLCAELQRLLSSSNLELIEEFNQLHLLLRRNASEQAAQAITELVFE